MDWKITNNRFIAFFDIMGFKDFVYRNDHDEVLKTMTNLHGILDPIVKESCVLTSGDNPSAEKFDAIVQTIVFSDSILFVTNNCTQNDFNTLTFNCAYLLSQCIKNRIPIKGAISSGIFTSDTEKSLYFGQPLIDAYLLQENLNYYGCILDNLTEGFIRSHMCDFYDAAYVFYKTPLKLGHINHFNLNWLAIQSEYIKDGASFISEKEEELNKFYLNVHGNPRKYVDNTINFYTACKYILLSED